MKSLLPGQAFFWKWLILVIFPMPGRPRRQHHPSWMVETRIGWPFIRDRAQRAADLPARIAPGGGNPVTGSKPQPAEPADGTEGSTKNQSFRVNRGRRRQSSGSRGSRSGQGGFAPRPGRLALLAHALARPGTRERGPAHQALAALLLVDALGFRLSRFCALTHKSILSESVSQEYRICCSAALFQEHDAMYRAAALRFLNS